MRKLLIILACVTLFSCSKKTDKPEDTTEGTAMMSYKLNGKLFSSPATVTKSIDHDLGLPMYYLKNITGILFFYTDSLEKKTYILDYNSFPGFGEGDVYYSLPDNSNLYIEATINSIENNKISGTFKGNVINLDTKEQASITDGKFENVEIHNG